MSQIPLKITPFVLLVANMGQDHGVTHSNASAPSPGQPTAPERAEAPPTRLPLRRPQRGRVVGGVATGLAAHLNVSVRTVRLVFILAAVMGGLGLALYIFWWVTIPAGDPVAAARTTQPAAQGRLSRGLSEQVRTLPVKDIAIGVLLLLGAGVLVASRFGKGIDLTWVIPVLIALAGLGLAWSQLDGVERGRWLSRAGGRTPVGVLRLTGGVVLVLLGVLLLVGQDEPAATLVQSGVAALAMLAGVGLVLAPWWIRLLSQLRFEQEARARESERADIAAHLHDSVLQTLALIRTGADDAVQVARLARAQERELREWLYSDRAGVGTSVAAELRAVVAEVEDGRTPRGPSQQAVAIDTVVVGDCEPSAESVALLQATREALVNAVVHGAPPISLYLEVGTDQIEAFIRDRGPGFDPAQIAADRFGVRESILGRVRRRGGRAQISTPRGGGTEVQLTVPRLAPAATDSASTPEGMDT